MGEIVKQGIAKKESASTQLFESLFAGETFLTIHYESPKDYVKQYWDALERAGQPNLHRSIFKYIIYSLLFRENIRPFYTQAKVAFVPNIEFDTILYSKERPICLSLKTSLRERYKQADLEAIALKYVHRKAQSYLLTLDSKEAKATKEKIPTGNLIGLDDVIDCNTSQIDELIIFLKKQNFCESTKIDVVTGNLVKTIE